MKKNIFTGFIILYTSLLSAQSNLNFEVKNLIYSNYPNTNIENTLLAINFYEDELKSHFFSYFEFTI